MENNKLIAEFMQWKKVNAGLIGYETPHSVALIKPSDMLFHTSWDWLMPVARKIEEQNELIAAHILSTDIDVTYKGVVKFIKKYNQKK
jgi:hypothetical protein